MPFFDGTRIKKIFHRRSRHNKERQFDGVHMVELNMNAGLATVEQSDGKTTELKFSRFKINPGGSFDGIMLDYDPIAVGSAIVVTFTPYHGYVRFDPDKGDLLYIEM